ncbi:hypothetical protein [Acinetobacter sp. ANC 4648]|uniref:hypothetical protein n=1 Tax=Acinetobacter sp. ANC 4648 TaxID=1977875 RepID=UPI000A32DA48|nr:hypothetical protein [Acinetobacter sp. ANC 4648]OTG82838.1 hypothetical protein B9T27_06080 [Acinetobacter sp. ANC 4648]
MKKIAVLILSCFVITGCATTQKTEDVETKGLLICKPNELCPIVTVIWNQDRKDILKVRVSLNDIYNKYEIEKVTFENGKKSYAFDMIGKTEQDFAFGANRSRNIFVAPVGLMNDLSGSNQITMNIYTDKGVISRYVYKDGKKASIYEQFMSVYK